MALVGGALPGGPGSTASSIQEQGPILRVAIADLHRADTPRLDGENLEHVRVLAGTGAQLPPILVHRQTMRVLDGMHRLLAARLRGESEIDARFFDGDIDQAFVVAVRANIAHGLPLTLADRKAAARRILAAYPESSDRVVAQVVGLTHKTVGALRRRPSGEIPHLDARRGRDGRQRPISGVDGRQKALDHLAANPDASLREIARVAGISPETARGIRRKFQDDRPRADAGDEVPASVPTVSPAPAPTGPRPRKEQLEQLMRDPSLRLSGAGRDLLRKLWANAMSAEEWQRMVEAVPVHRTLQIAEFARVYAAWWTHLADQLEGK